MAAKAKFSTNEPEVVTMAPFARFFEEPKVCIKV